MMRSGKDGVRHHRRLKNHTYYEIHDEIVDRGFDVGFRFDKASKENNKSGCYYHFDLGPRKDDEVYPLDYNDAKEFDDTDGIFQN